MAKNVRIKAFKEGFRRCGIAHAANWTYYNRDDFTDEQWELLINESNLSVQESPSGFAAEIKSMSLSTDPARLMEMAKQTDELLAAEKKRNERKAALQSVKEKAQVDGQSTNQDEV